MPSPPARSPTAARAALSRLAGRFRREPEGRRRELATLLLLVAVTAGVWGFLELGDEVGEGETREVDTAILLALRTPGDPSDPIGPGWFEETGRDFTALGGMAVLTLFTLAALGYLLLDGKRHAALLVVVAVGGGMLWSSGLKAGYDRPRPDLVPHGARVYTASFPSGHSMLSAATYLTLGALLARVHPRRRMKAYFLGVAVLLTVLVGASRVYLGVHWPTDVLGGWSGGSTWALACWLVARWLQRRGQVEQEPETE
jgi:undecaprenyl-diphosphatase